MPKYWVKNYFAHGRFPEVGQKQKTEKKREREKERKKERKTEQWQKQCPATRSERHLVWRTQSRLGQHHAISSTRAIGGHPPAVSNSKWVDFVVWEGVWQLGKIFVIKIFLVQACLRGPSVVVDEAKLAIVFTYFFLFSFSSSFSSTPSAFDPLRGISRVWKFVSPNILA